MQSTTSESCGAKAVQGMPLLILRLEGLIGFLGSLLIYTYFQGPWWLFALAFFAPDLSLLGYLINKRLGALVYNALHTQVLAALLCAAGLYFNTPSLFYLAIIATCHIHFDRMLGLGLKYDEGFKYTHMGIVGRWR